MAHPDRAECSDATNRTFLQLGNAIGIAIVVALLGTANGPDALRDFRHAWTLLAVVAIVCVAAIAASGLSRRTGARAARHR